MPLAPGLRLCALHPSPDVRRELLSLCPAGVPMHEAATAADLAHLPVDGTLVVLLDPARTSPAEVRAACPVDPELVSISPLRLSAADVGVDAVVVQRSLTAGRLLRVIGDAAQRRTLADAG